MPDTALPPARYLELVDADTDRLIRLGERGLDRPVPSCEGWTVSDVLEHTAMVFEHKVRVMADNAWPDPWPPAEYADREPVPFLRDAKARLFAEFARHQMDEQTTTFGADTTIGFWARRMALEVAVHRFDAELAHDEPTSIPGDLALDGIDEVLRLMLVGPWWERMSTEHPVDQAVAIQAESSRWLCTLSAPAVDVRDDTTSPARATVSGEPMDVFLWLWGRLPVSRVEVAGDPAVVGEFRGRISECTQ